MDELENLIEELQTSVRMVVSSPPANYVQVHQLPSTYVNGIGQSGGSIFRDNMNEIEIMLGQLDEPSITQLSGSQYFVDQSSAAPSFTLESLMNDLKEFQVVSLFLKTVEFELEREFSLDSSISSSNNNSNKLSPHGNRSQSSLPLSVAAAGPNQTQSVSPGSHYAGKSSGSTSGSSTAGVGGTKCAGCREQIQGQMVHALGRAWHMKHFLCSGCRSELGRQTFYEMSGRAYCEPCYQAEFSPKCAQCFGPILDRCVTALDKQWHPEHFFCQSCTAPFSETCGFHEKDGKPYCLDCYRDAFSPKCQGCGTSITSNYVTALDRMWHPDCFVCKDCGRDLGGGNFYELAGRPYCELHYHANRGSLCITCERPIASRSITAMGRKFHPECFQCAFCNNQLTKGTFMAKESKPYCNDCYGKLFQKK